MNYNRDDIEKAIIELKEMEQVTVDASIFARKSGLQKLINEIDELFN